MQGLQGFEVVRCFGTQCSRAWLVSAVFARKSDFMAECLYPKGPSTQYSGTCPKPEL